MEAVEDDLGVDCSGVVDIGGVMEKRDELGF